MLIAFTVAISLAAGLLFVVQPMVGKMILPLGGGSPQVWVTALVFFQAALLAGYAYAHLSVRWLGPRRQVWLHAAVLLLPFLALPVALPGLAPPAGGARSPWVLGVLTLMVGAPVFVLAAASPVLQSWLSTTRHPDARDPYFLYAGSNAGSLVGLLAYPFLVEPLLPLSVQSRAWTVGYGAFVALTLGCAALTLRSRPRDGDEPAPTGAERPLPPPDAPLPPGGRAGGGRPDRGDRLFWLVSAAVPSALLVGVTHYLTSRIVPGPVLWVLPLAVYLVTFIVAFARRSLVSVRTTSVAVGGLAVMGALGVLLRVETPVWAVTLLHLAVLGAAALLCHQRLAARRPDARHLTEFYLMVSAGGVLGGGFSALVAPVAFESVAEYPLALVAAAFFRVPRGVASDAAGGGVFARRGPRDLLLPGLLGVWLLAGEAFLADAPGVPDGVVVVALTLLPALAVYLLSRAPLRFAVALGLLLLLGQGRMYRGEILVQERTFFGVYRVLQDPGGSYNALYHGSTVHGIRSLDPERADVPLAYYHPEGPAGMVVSAVAGRPDAREIALVGGGTGALAALARPGQRVTIYEIDPVVMEIAEDPELFPFLARTPAEVRAVVADGRLGMAASETTYDIIVLDAFTSGSIPVHLMTREAVELYLERLRPGGVLLFHVSNRHLDLAPVLGAHARELGLSAFVRRDTRALPEAGILGSDWVLLARGPDDLRGIPSLSWHPLRPGPDAPSWTDDFSSLLGVQRWLQVRSGAGAP